MSVVMEMETVTNPVTELQMMNDETCSPLSAAPMEFLSTNDQPTKTLTPGSITIDLPETHMVLSPENVPENFAFNNATTSTTIPSASSPLGDFGGSLSCEMMSEHHEGFPPPHSLSQVVLPLTTATPVTGEMTSAQLPGITVERTPMAFVLVRFHRLFGVYYVPATCLRADIAVGGLVLCECHHGEAAGVVVKDVSEQVIEYARLAPEESEPAGGRTLEWIEERCVAELQQGSPLFNLTSRSGMPTDFQMLRFPRVLRRGVNKDKKKMYYARWRDREMLPLVQRLIAERGLECRFTVEEVEYQVDFRSITLYIQEHAVDPQWGQLDYTLLGDVLTGPLRTDRVEFRLTDRRDQLHITGHLLEPSMNASLMELLNSVRDYPPPFGVTPQPTRSMAEGKSVFMMQHLMANSMMDDMQSSAASNFSGTGANPSPMTMYAAPQTTQGVRFTGAPITYIPGSTHAAYHADAASGQMTYVQPMMQQPSYTLVQTPPQPTILPQNIAYAPNTTASLNNMCIFLPPGAQAGNTPNVAFTAPQQPSMPLQLLTATNGMQYVPTYVNGTVSSAAPPMVPQPTYAPTQMFVQAPAQLPPGYPYNVGYLPQ